LYAAAPCSDAMSASKTVSRGCVVAGCSCTITGQLPASIRQLYPPTAPSRYMASVKHTQVVSNGLDG
jgi:hypothetical protein